VCILIYLSMYLCSYPSTHGISGLPACSAWEQFELRLKMTMEWTQRYNWRPWWSECGEALGGREQVNTEVNLEDVIKRVWRCMWRPPSCNSKMHLGAVIDWVWTPNMERMIKQDWRSTWRRMREGAAGAETQSISWLTRDRGNVMRWLNCWALMESWQVAVDHVGRHAGSWSYIQGSTRNREDEGITDNLGRMVYSVYAGLGVWCTWCMLYSMYAVLRVCCSPCMLYSVSTHDDCIDR